MAIQSYAPSLYEACAINDSVKRAMAHLSEVTSVTKVKLNTDYNFTDTSKAQYRYQAVFDLFYYDE